nr:hypothetical protein DGKKSRWO_DGKKSRWO_CDS_0074 [uncultured phage]CAI9752241.1 hypothetical protein CVNMHQAP_CVNMHQAP_CDS_0074 [uncultured phage]
MTQISESSLNRVLSHLNDRDVAMITAFRTDPSLGYSNTENIKRNKELESDLRLLGYTGYTKITGYWDETPDVENSEPTKEESYLVLNTGSSSEEFVDDLVGLANKYDQQGVMIWDHNNKVASVYDDNKRVLATMSNFNIDTLSQGWTQIKGHEIAFTEAINSSDFSDKFNQGGNFVTAMAISARKNKWRKDNNV